MGFFAKGRQGFADGVITWNTNRLLAYLLDVDIAGPASGAWKISTVTYSGNTFTITTSASHSLTTGDEVEIWAIAGITNPPLGVFTATQTGATTFQVTTTGTAPTGSHTASTGYLINLGGSSVSSTSGPSSLTDINAATTAIFPAVAATKVPIAVSGRSTSSGILDAPNIVFTSVTFATVEAFVIVKASDIDVSTLDNTPASQRLILCQTPATSGLTGLPQTPSNGNINLDFASQGIGRI